MITKNKLMLLLCILVTRSNSYILKSLDTRPYEDLENNLKPLGAFYNNGFKTVSKTHILKAEDAYSEGSYIVRNEKPSRTLYSGSRQANKRYIMDLKDTTEGTQYNLKPLDARARNNSGSKQVNNRIDETDLIFGAVLTMQDRAPVYEPKMVTRPSYKTNTGIVVGKCPAGYHKVAGNCILNDPNYDD